MAESTITEITFEQGDAELRRIVARLDESDVSVSEMCELFARGKGLEQSLREYLETQKGKLDEIEAGQNLPRFRIVASSTGEKTGPRAEQERPAAEDVLAAGSEADEERMREDLF